MPKTPQSYPPPLSPRTWPLWPVVGLAWGLTRLPFRWQRWLGRGIGHLFYALGRERRHITRVNIDLCFPELSAAEREALVKAHFTSAGMGALETVSGWWAADRRFAGLYTLEGLEHLDAALAQGHGVLLVSAHFTHLEFCARILSLHRRFAAMYRPNRNQVLDYLFKRNRNYHTLGAIERNDIKGLLRSLKNNQPVWYAPDQAGRGKQFTLAPFFGLPAATQTATHRIAKVSGAPVLPFFGRRTPDGHYVLTIHPPLENFPGADSDQDAARINAVMEEAIRLAPEQYFWSHRRFKGRPGLADPY